ncbi:MAG: sialidase family protein [Planctomycetota bacterium]|nr:sialidase family protein [Planctomycetota bacterium]
MTHPIQPWLTNRPIVNVRKELHRRHTRPGAAAVVGQLYVGPGLERMEIQAVEAKVDIHTEMMRRWSPDNGRTWTPLEPMEPFVARHSGVDFVEVGGTKFHDPVSGLLVEAWLRQVPGQEDRPDAQAIRDYPAGIMTRQFSTCRQFHTFTYIRLSSDLGRTWTAPRQLRYEPGPDFNPAHPLDPAFIERNQAYFGNNFIRHSNGSLILGLCAANAPNDPLNSTRYCRLGALLVAGRWDPALRDYHWTPGQRIEVPYELSFEGLQEPAVAELRDGRVLVIWRASVEGYAIGRKYVSLSSDGGMTLEPLRPLGYDDGSLFYSPASIHHLARHSVTGKLYWFGNISRVPPRGNWPRYPLVVAEVDEERVALKRDTVIVIDDRAPDQSEYVEFSNFWLIENRETHDWEITLTAYGEDPEQVNNADCYRYVLTPR